MKTNKTNIIVTISLYALLGFATLGCSDDFLINEPIMQNVQSTYYSNDDQMFNALMATYDIMQWQCGAGMSNPIPFSEIRSDNARTGGGSEGDQPDMQKLEDFTNESVNSYSDAIFKRDYKCIYRANLVINSEYESDITKVYKAEALFLRAWNYFDLLRTYGPCPITLDAVHPSDYKSSRSTRLEINQQIEKDLLAAIPELPKSYTDDMVGRITQGAAQALLGKVYVYWADWTANDDPTLFDKAANMFQTVISNNQYQLMNDYSKIFCPHSENNLETIFEIQRTTTSGCTNWGTSDSSEGAFWENFAGPRSMSNNHPLYYSGWGFMLPTKELYDYFLPDDTLRRYSAMLTPERLQKDAHAIDASVVVTWAIDAYNSVDWEGQAQGKYLIWKDYSYIGAQALNNAGGEKLIRYSNVYLMLAECYLRGSNKNEVKAKDLIDEVRKAHVAKGSNAFDHVDDLLIKYPERFKTIMDILWYERRVEFAGEGDRWYDLVRSGRAKSIITKLMDHSYPNSQWNDHDIYLPLGSIEMEAAKGTLSEYPDETYPYSTLDLSYTEEQ